MPARFIDSLDDVMRRPDVVIVGAGIVGLASAFFASLTGMRPLVVDRLPSPASLTSRRSGEGVRAQWELPQNIEIARRSIDLYRRFGEVLGDERQSAGYNPVGYLYASRTATGAADLAARVRRQREVGLDDVLFLERDEIQKRFPLIALDATGAAFRQDDGTVTVASIISGYLACMDADILLDTELVGVESCAGSAVVDTSAGSIEAGSAVLANGARLAVVAQRWDPRLRLSTARSTILHVKTPSIPISHPAVIDTDIGSFWRPNLDGARITASFRGLLFVEDGTDDPLPDPDYFAHAIRTIAPMVPLWSRIAPHLGDSHLRSGTFAVTADGAPLIGPVPDAPNLFVNGGYGGHGIMMSPDGGRRLAAMLASGGELSGNPFSPARFFGAVPPPAEPMTIHVKSDQKGSA